jgi:hypothetical protein
VQTLRWPGQEQEESEVVGRGEEAFREEEGCWVREARKRGRRFVVRLVWKLGLRVGEW